MFRPCTKKLLKMQKKSPKIKAHVLNRFANTISNQLKHQTKATVFLPHENYIEELHPLLIQSGAIFLNKWDRFENGNGHVDLVFQKSSISNDILIACEKENYCGPGNIYKSLPDFFDRDFEALKKSHKFLIFC